VGKAMYGSNPFDALDDHNILEVFVGTLSVSTIYLSGLFNAILFHPDVMV
jgi:hypothetical protein